MTAQDLWDFSREANKYLGALVAMMVMWRLVPQLLDRDRWRNARALHLIFWFSWIAAASINATIASIVTNGTPNALSFTRMILSVIAILLCMWWPHPIRYVSLDLPLPLHRRRPPQPPSEDVTIKRAS
jgi:hypothetical protein